MNLRGRPNGGFALIVTLMVTLVIAMMLGATLALSPGRLARSGNTGDLALAEGAIEAGIEYARARLQEDPEWKGDLNRVVVNEPTLYIEEQDGMVVGLLRPDVTEPFSMFRIRFNFYNGAPIAGEILDDGLDDPSSTFRFDLNQISINNLNGPVRFVPKPDEFNMVMNFTNGDFEIDPGTAMISVEGFGGNGLNRIGPGNYSIPPGSRGYARHRADAVLGIAFEDGAPNASMMGGGDLNITLPPGSGVLNITAKGETPKARSKGDVNAIGGSSANYVSNGELLFNGTENVNESSGTSLGTDGAAPFYTLEWDDIHKASSDPTEAIHLKGGTYIFDDSGDLHYFDLSLSDFQAHVATRQGASQDPFDHTLNSFESKQVNANLMNVRTDSMAANAADVSSSKVKFTEDVLVNPSASGVVDFTLIPTRGSQSSSTDTTGLSGIAAGSYQKDVEIELSPKKGKAAFTTTGDTLVAAKVNSSKGGSFVTEGDLRIDAGKLDKYGNVGVSFYSKKDISISTYEPSADKYLPVGVDGLFYAWNDFTVRTGETGLSPSKWEKVKLVGSAVAYGTDTGPSLIEAPGSNLGGNLNVIAKEAEFKWDDKKLGDLLSVAKYGELTLLKRVSYIRY